MSGHARKNEMSAEKIQTGCAEQWRRQSGHINGYFHSWIGEILWCGSTNPWTQNGWKNPVSWLLDRMSLRQGPAIVNAHLIPLKAVSRTMDPSSSLWAPDTWISHQTKQVSVFRRLDLTASRWGLATWVQYFRWWELPSGIFSPGTIRCGSTNLCARCNSIDPILRFLVGFFLGRGTAILNAHHVLLEPVFG